MAGTSLKLTKGTSRKAVPPRALKGGKVASVSAAPRNGAGGGNGKKTITGRSKSQRAGSRPVPTEPTAEDIAARQAVAQAFFNPATAATARAAFLKRQQPKPPHAG